MTALKTVIYVWLKCFCYILVHIVMLFGSGVRKGVNIAFLFATDIQSMKLWKVDLQLAFWC